MKANWLQLRVILASTERQTWHSEGQLAPFGGYSRVKIQLQTGHLEGQLAPVEVHLGLKMNAKLGILKGNWLSWG